MLHLRGLSHLNMNNLGLAKADFQNALMADVLCYDSLVSLLEHNMMTGNQGRQHLVLTLHTEQEFLNSLDFSTAGNDLAELVKSVYQSKLKKYHQQTTIEPVLQKLDKDFRLCGGFHVQLERADALFSICKYKKCLEITNVLYAFISNLRTKNDFTYNTRLLLIHIACLVQVDKHLVLFSLSHHLVDSIPKRAISWYAVGCYYLLVKVIPWLYLIAGLFGVQALLFQSW